MTSKFWFGETPVPEEGYQLGGIEDVETWVVLRSARVGWEE